MTVTDSQRDEIQDAFDFSVDDVPPTTTDETTDAQPRRPRGLLAVVALLAALLIGVLAGGIAFLTTSPTVRPPAVDLSPDDVSSARDSVASAKMMVDLMASAVDSGTSAIDDVSSAIAPTFASIDTATQAAGQMADGLAKAPRLADAAARVQDLGRTVSRSLDEAGNLATSARDIDELVTPIIDGLSKNKVPGADKTIEQLRSLQAASRSIGAKLGDLGALRAELERATAATGPAAREIDGALDRARTASTELRTGLQRLAAARGDTEQAAESLSDGVGKLKATLAMVSNNLSSADDSLISDETQPAMVYDHANRVGTAVVAGSIASIVLVAVGAGGWLLARRRAAA